MATVEETYKIALENRNAINLIKDKAKTTDEFPLVSAVDTDLVRVTRGCVSSHTPVSDIRALTGAGEDNVQANWDETNTGLDAYIRNKPIALSEFIDDINAGGGGGVAGVFSDTITGLYTGGVVSINTGDNTKFDVSAGTGVIVSWIDPANPIRTELSWVAQIAVSIPDMSSGFSIPYMTSNGTILVTSGITSSPEVRRSRIQLQTLSHPDGLMITGVGRSSRPAYEVTQALMDYVTELGVIVKGNQLNYASNNLQIRKDNGTTTFPFVNRSNNAQNPTTLSMGAQNPIANFIYAYRDGVGGSTISPVNSVLTPGSWDDDSGVLQNVASSKYSTQRYYFIAATNTIVMLYGRAIYNSMDEAQSNIFLEDPVIDEALGFNEFLTAVILKGNATDLSNDTHARFVEISSGSVIVDNSPTGVGDMTKAEYDTNSNGIVDNSEALNGKPDTDFVLQIERYVIGDGEFTIHKGIGNTLNTLEANDFIIGQWDALEFWRLAKYNGGTTTLKASYTLYDYVEI